MSKLTKYLTIHIIGIQFCSSFLLAQWEPPTQVTREEIVETSQKILSLPNIPIVTREDLFQIRALEMDWDME